MMLASVLLASSFLVPSPNLLRDTYGVPHIRAASYAQAFFDAGYAVAQDRLWQMELSRRLARGRLAALVGPTAVSSDREILQTGYDDSELKSEFERLSPPAKDAIVNYVRGVNAWITTCGANRLPKQFLDAGIRPADWTTLDSVAICIHLLQIFGHGGAGELRNMAALAYLKGQKALKGRALDVFDDLAWANDPDAVPTVANADDPLAKSHVRFYYPDRETTERQLADLPKIGLLDLIGALHLTSRDASTRLAERLNVPYRTGSYCVVVGGKHSVDGRPLLLSGPQMGLRTPSIVHEMSIEAPGIRAEGMDVPGVPGVIVGFTRQFAWGITSGEADTDDIFYYASDGTTYRNGDTTLPVERATFTLKVKGAPDQIVERSRIDGSPVVLMSGSTKTAFAKRSGYWLREMDTFNAWVHLWSASSSDEIVRAMSGATMNFNFFYATRSGDIGWHFLGLIPKRADGIDPRFPTPGDPKYAWKGFLTSAEMPHVRNPGAGFLANWNNKPCSWWPNFDTPTWGKVFENTSLLAAIGNGKLSLADMEAIPEKIAKSDETWPFFKPYLAGTDLAGFDGKLIDGSTQASTYRSFVEHLREILFRDKTGNFLDPDLFRLVLQPSVLLRALEGKTRFDYLAGKSAQDVVRQVLAEVESKARPPYVAGGFRTFDTDPIPYSNRGTYIQILELRKEHIVGLNVLPPGESESGPHRNDQSALARAFEFKPVNPLR
ncbi:MAG: penicillin acylase family protein [Fimbriimonas sp.]|nr:penicillin acylase family protein [Fimbriimonas sp.]